MLSEAEISDFRGRVSAAVGVLNAAHGRLVELVEELLAAELWAGTGFRSPEHWLTVRAGVSHATARRLVDVARRRAELPVTTAGLDAGALSLDHAHTVAQFAPAYVDPEVAQLAEHATVPQLRSVLAKYRFAPDAPTEAQPGCDPGPDAVDAIAPQLSAAEKAAVAPGSLTSWHDEYGRYHLRVEAPADEGALIDQALRHARDILFNDPSRGAAAPVRSYDALRLVCERSFGAGDQPRDRRRRDRFGVYLHLDSSGSGWLDGGRAVPPALLAKITCDGAVRPLWMTAGVPVNVGRAQRVAPGHTRRLVIDRDAGCTFPGCGATGHLEVHHIRHWADGGRTDTDNLVSLCPHHHDAHHRGEFTVAGNADHRSRQPDRVVFHDPGGEVIGPLRPTPPPDPLPPPPGRGFTTRTGERFDHGLVSFRGPPAA